MSNSLRSALLLAALLASSGAAAPRVFVDGWSAPGVLPDPMNDAQLRGAALMLLLARDDLAGVKGDGAVPWPCVEDDTIAAFMSPNTAGAYAALKTTFRTRGWTLEREVKAPDAEQYSFLWRKGDLYVLGRWAKASVGNRSTLAACRRAANWKPAPPPPAAATAPRLALPFVAATEGWSGGPRGLRLTALDENDEPRLVARGEVTAAGRLTLGLPGRPDPALLRPASEWAGVFGAPECDAPGGRVAVSDPRALLLAVDEATVLRAVPAPGATAAQVLAAPADGERALVNAGMFDGGQVVRRVRLVYSSGPVTLRGTLACPGEPPLKVDVALPGGWSAVVQEDHLPDAGAPFQTLGNPTGGQERRGWREWSF